MEFKFNIGAVADIASGKELNDACQNLQGHFDKRFRSLTASRPLRRTISVSTTLTLAQGQSQSIPFVPQGPSPGRMWLVTRFTVVGTDDHTTAANVVAALYVGDPANPYLGGVLVPGQAIPYYNTYNDKSIPCHDSEALFINFSATGAVTGQNVTASASVMEWVDAGIESQVV